MICSACGGGCLFDDNTKSHYCVICSANYTVQNGLPWHIYIDGLVRAGKITAAMMQERDEAQVRHELSILMFSLIQRHNQEQINALESQVDYYQTQLSTIESALGVEAGGDCVGAIEKLKVRERISYGY
jgi:hypothetical protein